MLLAELRAQVCHLHALLPANHLVAWTSGNISARDPQTGLIVIKPSGVGYDDLTPENMVVVDEHGTVVEGDLIPSSDTASHCYIYRAAPEVFGVAHTHSRYATAFAALGRSVPCVLTAMADEFGGEIPCGGFALIGGEEIGQEVMRCLRDSHSPAALMQNHGVFTVGKSAQAAVKAAVMAEDVAATVWLAEQLGQPIPISSEHIAQLHHRYTQVYGQPKEEIIA
ncbi:MAG TPA: L-ribulose-5-phosphate 4-epimerase [Ktedonobacterales bacterium]|nr:L-ribulose-5-phosphate 4-epimerase [Ktedonobacterales bacterium]